MRILEEALTFDDVLLVPAYSEVLPREVSLASRLTREISVNLPIVSAAMDTVTEARLAITSAQQTLYRSFPIPRPGAGDISLCCRGCCRRTRRACGRARSS